MTNLVILSLLLFYFVGVPYDKKDLITNYTIPNTPLNLRVLVVLLGLWFQSNFTELYQQTHPDTHELQL